ncbi:MAG TPA: CpsD/CapB family tyrosine-protein kinase [Vicinamibacterales bacterium]
MTRLSDALARAGEAAPAGVEIPAGPSLPTDLPAELWPAEGPAEHRDPADDLTRGIQDEADRSSAPVPAALHPGAVDEKLVTRTLEHAPIEQYRRLAARLHLAQAEAGTKVVMITSAVPSEGKTLTATNLALTLSESYKRRVLLIDADLRRPWVHELFRLPNLTGLNDGIRSDAERKVPLIRLSEYLSVLTAGRPDPDPMSVLSSDRMRRILKDAAASFDWVIVDTPPVAVLSDAHLLARLVDTVVLVVRAGSTQHPEMSRAIDAVGRDRILGVVLNCADHVNRLAYNSYGYGTRVDQASGS